MSRSVEWAAGLFEGEGCIDIQRTHGYEYPRLQLAMTDEDVVREFHAAVNRGRVTESQRALRLQLASTDEDVVRRFASIVGYGKVYGPYGPRPGQTKSVWNWTADGGRAKVVLAALLPYLGERRTARAQEVLGLVR